MVVLLRFLVVMALCFWQGGFLFYAAIVVPIGTRVLGSILRQGFITRHVTHDLNIAAAAALVLLMWEWVWTADPARWRRHARLFLWALITGIQVALFILHADLDSRMVSKG